MTKSTSVETRFWSYVIKTTEFDCWSWMGTKTGIGYGQLRITRTPSIRQQAHRYSYELHNLTKIPPGALVCHTCDNPSCVNPKHLFLGSHKDNTMDMMQKGRNKNPLGSLHGMAKLKEVDIPEILALLHSGMTHEKISKIYGVCRATITSINMGANWSHLSRSTHD